MLYPFFSSYSPFFCQNMKCFIWHWSHESEYRIFMWILTFLNVLHSEKLYNFEIGVHLDNCILKYNNGILLFSRITSMAFYLTTMIIRCLPKKLAVMFFLIAIQIIITPRNYQEFIYTLMESVKWGPMSCQRTLEPGWDSNHQPLAWESSDSTIVPRQVQITEFDDFWSGHIQVIISFNHALVHMLWVWKKIRGVK